MTDETTRATTRHFTRNVGHHPAGCRAVATDEVSDFETWLNDRAKEFHLKWLLAFEEEGVVWGTFEPGGLITSGEVAKQTNAKPYCPELHLETLQQARLFGPQAEVLLWRDADAAGKGRWQARVISEAPGEAPDWSNDFDEQQILWGTEAVLSLPSATTWQFTLMSDGAPGYRHAPPLQVTGKFDERARPLRLTVRNYLKEDETGFVRVAASRLVEVRK